MLELKKITKVYDTGDFKQKALDEVSVNFRKCEFVSILGPSGSGKTTMLNIIGGLDEYTSGDLIINGVSTKDFKDKDWDAYRNHRVGFVFQSYNLIGHQSVLANVELALTLSGVGKKERRKRAKEVLIEVGLKDHMHKRPNQLSGGQMQRVAIARALINNPDILLADEPTGALDTITSTQIMNILKEIAKEKLVIMVTHNSDLANDYSNRIVKVLDGHILEDTNPYTADDSHESQSKTKKKSHRTSMSFFTALSLSLTNLLTKKGRTILTAFAGSIGIIGIALIMSLSSGVQDYINKVQEDTLSSYPLSIEASSIDYSSLISTMTKKSSDVKHKLDKVYSNNIMTNIMESMATGTKANDLGEFKTFLDSNKSDIKDYVNDIKYLYNIDLNLYKSDTSNGVVQVSPVTILEKLGMRSSSSGVANINSYSNNSDIWMELSDNQKLLNKQYDVVAGKMPTKYNEIVLVLDENNEISDYALYALGLRDQSELFKSLASIIKGGKFTAEETSYTYQQILDLTYKLVLNTSYYEKDDNEWVSKQTDNNYMKNLVDSSETIKVVGIIKPKKDANLAQNSGGMAYSADLVKYLVNNINDSEIAKEQVANPNTDVFTGTEFTGTSTYENNIKTLGIVDLNSPSTIELYSKNFDAKDKIESIIKDYNNSKTKAGKDDEVINYTDYVGLLMSSVKTIVNIISYVLIAFVSISLIVSSIMIGIITYISVLERTKEIGILRAIGASKKDISRVFNAETFIIGSFAGLLGIGVTILLNIPINIFISKLTGISNITKLPFAGAVILILISMILTIFAGLIPAKMASKKDPVEALRTE